MSHLVVVGLNHRTAPLDTRQRAAFEPERLAEGMRELSGIPGILEAMILSTCNRVEAIAHVAGAPCGPDAVEAWLSGSRGIPRDELRPFLYRYEGESAVRHVFRVASSLDSMILGEPQILGQVKSCYAAAVDARSVGPWLNHLLQAAFRTAKRVRSETSIGEYPVSSSSAAVELARKIFGELSGRRVLVVGAGKMGETAVRHLVESGVGSIAVVNRSAEAARALAERFDGAAGDFSRLGEMLAGADIVITSTGSPEILIPPPLVEEAMRRRRQDPMVFIDISVPRNVDPGVGAIENVFCYDIDDLSSVVDANLGERLRAAGAAEKIVDQEVRAFAGKIRSLKSVPMVREIQGRIEEICRSELERFLKKGGGLDARQLRELESMMSRVAAKIAHPLLEELRHGDGSRSETALTELLQQLLQPRKGKP
jgi:glutamyl-tRNA reductase